MKTCLLRWTTRGRSKTSSKWKTSILPNAEHIPKKDWTLLKELSEVGNWPWLQQSWRQQPRKNREWQILEELPLENVKKKSRPTPRSWHLISPILTRKWKSAIVSRGLNNIFQYTWGASNAKNMNTTGKLTEEEKYMPSTVKKTQTTYRKIVKRKLDVQTADMAIQLTQDFVMSIKKKRKY